MSPVDPVAPARSTGRRPKSFRQPALGLFGLLLVIPIAAALAIGAGADGSTLVLGPLVIYALPLVVMVGFWWENWPGTRLRARWSGWVDTALIAAGAIVLTGLGQSLAGRRLDPVGLFDPAPGPGHVPTFPATLPLGATAFVAMLQITLVGEGWPLRGLRRLTAGLLAVALSWVAAVVVQFALVRIEPPAGTDVVARQGPVPAADLGATLVLIGAWQVIWYVVWRGWPFSTITTRSLRLCCAHASVLGAGVLTYGVTHVLLHVDATRIAAVAGCVITAGLVFGMLFEDWLHHLSPRAERTTLLLATLTLTALLVVVLDATAGALHLPHVSGDEWVEQATLVAIPTSIILHVAIGRRWPFVSGRERLSAPTGSDHASAAPSPTP